MITIILYTNPPPSILSVTCTHVSLDSYRRGHRLSLPGHRMKNYLHFLQELAIKQVRNHWVSCQRRCHLIYTVEDLSQKSSLKPTTTLSPPKLPSPSTFLP